VTRDFVKGWQKGSHLPACVNTKREERKLFANATPKKISIYPFALTPVHKFWILPLAFMRGSLSLLGGSQKLLSVYPTIEQRNHPSVLRTRRERKTAAKSRSCSSTDSHPQHTPSIIRVLCPPLGDTVGPKPPSVSSTSAVHSIAEKPILHKKKTVTPKISLCINFVLF
jgi:hypothetical protein